MTTTITKTPRYSFLVAEYLMDDGWMYYSKIHCTCGHVN